MAAARLRYKTKKRRTGAIALLISWFGLALSARAEEMAKSTDAFIDSMGVNTHFAYAGDTKVIYRYNNYARVKTVLVDLGVRHLRDGLVYNLNKDKDSLYNQKLRDLAGFGILSDLICDPSQASPADSLDAIKVVNGAGSIVEAVEGPNEPDNRNVHPCRFPTKVMAFPRGPSTISATCTRPSRRTRLPGT